MFNETAPDFSLMATTGNQVSLADLKGQFVVLVFYPLNDSPTCNTQLKEFNEVASEFETFNAVIFGVNSANVQKHEAYCIRLKLDIPILSDKGRKVAKAYKAHFDWLLINKRTVVVIDPNGVICYYERGKPPVNSVLDGIKSRSESLGLQVP